MKEYRAFNGLFALILLVQVLMSYLGNSPAVAFLGIDVVDFLRLFLILFLAIFLVVKTRLSGRFHKRIFTGLVCASLADLLLIQAPQNQSFYRYSLAAILVCVIFYTRAFYLDFRSAPELDKRGARIAISVSALLAIAFYFYLRPHVGAMKLPVMICILLGSFLTLMACFRNQRVNTRSFNLILFGAILFLLSGSVLSMHLFVQPIGHATTWLFASYAIAQYLITMGAIERKLVHTS